ncbi:hypothetical protein [Alkaliphilus hydrothermalis]|uniref:Uncharacterized protein n=1 Tax=Alkaliphilus hydrothermalis TaxID=1482730 RepID=A0ABS2NL42_9FIRM|nr:hypothetical protein [Alkaliphilus hydrothermalis]MBM7613643.1 hypothetical protein [Alkaliphilus hydrothermalis]
MKVEILKTKMGMGVTFILLVGAIVGSLNFYIVSPQDAAETIIKELSVGNEVFDITEDQKQLVNQVIFGVNEYDLPSLVMKFNKSVEIRKGLFQKLDIEEVETSGYDKDLRRVAIRVNLKDTVGEDGVLLTNERTYTGVVMLTLQKVSMRKWGVEKVEAVPFRDTSI